MPPQCTSYDCEPDVIPIVVIARASADAGKPALIPDASAAAHRLAVANDQPLQSSGTPEAMRPLAPVQRIRTKRDVKMTALPYLLLSLLLVHGTCIAQKKIPVEVAHVGEDAVGHLVAHELRAAIRAAHGGLVVPDLLEASEHPDGLRLTMELARPRIRLQVVGPNASHTGPQTPIAVNIVYDSADMPLGGAYIRSMLEMCGVADAGVCAARILAATSRSIDWMRQNWPSLWKTL
jgi:hypothetical protein